MNIKSLFILITIAASIQIQSATPTLLFSSPQNGSTGVAAQTPLAFVFSEAMQASESIAWSANVSPDKFLYFWSNDKTSLTAFYTAGFPSGATITWQLNPVAGAAANFRDVSGNELVAATYSGSFTIAGSTNSSPGSTNSNSFCQTGDTNDPGHGSFGVFKLLNYVQTNAAPPVIQASGGAMFSASMTPRTNQTYTSAMLTTPASANLTLSNFFGTSFFLFQNFDTQAALDASFPNGTYTLRAQGGASGQAAASLAFPAAGYPPVPQVLNLPELESMNPNADFTLRWNSFTGASGQFDTISLEISDASHNTVFFAPDYCLPRLLPNTATSIVIPAGTFKTSGHFSGVLQFSRFTGDTNSIPGSIGSAGFAVATQFGFDVGATNQVSAPRWTDIHRNANGSVTLQLSGSANQTYTVQASADLSAWATVLTTNSPSGTVTYTDSAAAATQHRYFRAQVQ